MCQYVTRRMTEKIRNDINDERHRQNETWGYNDHHIFKWLTIINEELGEAAAEALEIDFLEREPRSEKDSNSYMNTLIREHREKLRKELIQVAASVIATLEHLDRKLDI